MKVTVQHCGGAAGIYIRDNAGSQRKTDSAGDFQYDVKAQTSGTGKEYRVLDRKSDIKNEILNKFPELKEEKLNQLLNDYDIENMDSEELFKLAEELMEENVIPPRPQEGGLNLMFVLPTELFFACQRGEAKMPAATVHEAPDCFYAVNSGAGEMAFEYPGFGVRNLQYDLKMCQDAFKRFESYYTEDELTRQIQLTNSKARFLELAEMLASYKEEL